MAILLRRDGKGMNLKKVYRLYREERLTVRNLLEELGQARVERIVAA